MRKALIALLMAATAATPLAVQAQDQVEPGDRYEQRAARAAARAERAQRPQREERAAQPAAASEASQERQHSTWQGRRQRTEAAPTQQSWQGRRQRIEGAQTQQGWQGRRSHQGQQSWRGDRRDGDRGSYQAHIEATREASRRSAEGTPPSYQRQAERNQQAYERSLREQRYDRRDRDGDWQRHDRRDGGGNWSGDRRTSRNWDRNWRNDRRYDWQNYRYSNRNIFRGGSYYSPYRNHRYTRFSIGLFLDNIFFGQRYWIGDPWQYRLPPAYPGTRWIRYYDDVLLVDLYTGEVIDVIYDFFW